MDMYTAAFYLMNTYLLIFVRTIGFFVVMPVFGGQNIPTVVKVGMSAAIAAVILTGQGVSYQLPSNEMFTFIAILTKELFVGLILGFAIYFLFSVIYFVGQIVDFQIGFSMVSVFDPVTQIQVPISGNLFYLTISALMVVTGAYQDFFRAIFYSYKVLPIGEAIIITQNLFESTTMMLVSFFSIGFKIALPVIGAILVLEVALGLLTKTVPQMNIFSVGLPVKLMFGLIVLFVVFPTFAYSSNFIFNEINRAMLNIIRGMMP